MYSTTVVPHLFTDSAFCPLSNVDREDGVAPVGVFVQVVHGGRSHQLAPVEEVQGLLLRLHLVRAYITADSLLLILGVYLVDPLISIICTAGTKYWLPIAIKYQT